MKYDLVVSDFDWTLGKSPDLIEEQTVKAIKEYEKKGGKFVIVTGRSYSSISEICKKHGLTGLVGCFQGSDIAEVGTGKHLFKGGIDYRLAAKTVEELLVENVPVVAWAGDTLFYRETSYYAEQYLGFEKVSLIKTKSVSESLLKLKEPVAKICAVCNEEDVSGFVAKYAEKYKGILEINSGAKRLVEVIKPELNKGFAVKFIADYYNVPLNKVMTIGDSTNDIKLVQGEWFGVAVGDASEELKKVAKEVTLPFPENPVLHLLKKYCLDT